MSRVFITAMARTPFGKFRGMLSGLDSIDLGTVLLNELVDRDGSNGEVNAVIGGSGLLGGSYLTSLRQMVIRSQLPNHTVSMSVDRACCSGMTAISSACLQLRAGVSSKVVAVGVESLSNMPVLLSRGSDRRIASLSITDPLLLSGRVSPKTIAEYTSQEALNYGISRTMQDDWACASHERYFHGVTQGILDPQLFELPDITLAELRDEGPRRESDRAKLSKLATVNGSSTITAGNAPGLSDGAAGLVLMNDETLKRDGVDPIAEIIDWVQVAGDIQQGTSVPQVALSMLMKRNQLSLGDISTFEINEAFAATPLVSLRLLAQELGVDEANLHARTNVFGGSVAIGHPLGASGVRVVMQAASILRQRGGGLALCAICGGFGQGEAVLIKV